VAIQRALISVSDKTGLIEFAQALAQRGVVLLSTGGTFQKLEAAGVPVQTVESYTGSPEVMDGRVKTLHPKVHGGLLARRGHDEADMTRIGAEYIDLVIVNLYPFEQTLKKNPDDYDGLVENIDIGGPSMLRSAAKNHARVTVVCDSADYATVLAELDAEPLKRAGMQPGQEPLDDKSSPQIESRDAADHLGFQVLFGTGHGMSSTGWPRVFPVRWHSAHSLPEVALTGKSPVPQAIE